MIAPKPASRPDRVSLWRYWQMFRSDILSAQPARLYRAKMAEFRTPFFRSFLVNEPDLIARVLTETPKEFPKSTRVTRGLAPLLGASVFVTNGEDWARQRRIIDPAFEGGRVREMFPAMVAAADAMMARLEPGDVDVEQLASHATADVIFRALFSVPIDDTLAARTYTAFRAFQRSQPVARISALVPWVPNLQSRAARRTAADIRAAIGALVAERRLALNRGDAPDDLATKLMQSEDPEDGTRFTEAEVVDQVAIFFLAGHETSAALLGWALWLLAAAPEWGRRVEAEAEAFSNAPSFAGLSQLPVLRDVLRETLRLYPPVPMFVREATRDARFRNRDVRPGDQVVISPWHLHRSERHWENPDVFDPSRWQGVATKEAYVPFSKGPRVCPGAGFAMTEVSVLLAALLASYRFETRGTPVPVAHLTVRSRDGITLRAVKRET